MTCWGSRTSIRDASIGSDAEGDADKSPISARTIWINKKTRSFEQMRSREERTNERTNERTSEQTSERTSRRKWSARRQGEDLPFRRTIKGLILAARSYIRSGGMRIELRWFIDAVCPRLYCDAVSVHILLLVLLRPAPLPSLVGPSPPSPSPPPPPPPPLHRGVRRQCDMQYGNHRGTLRGPTWMLHVVAQPLNRLPGAYGKGSTTGQRHASPPRPSRRGPTCIAMAHAVHESPWRFFVVPVNRLSWDRRRRWGGGGGGGDWRQRRLGKTTGSTRRFGTLGSRRSVIVSAEGWARISGVFTGLPRGQWLPQRKRLHPYRAVPGVWNALHARTPGG